jgi:hypothetical protein
MATLPIRNLDEQDAITGSGPCRGGLQLSHPIRHTSTPPVLAYVGDRVDTNPFRPGVMQLAPIKTEQLVLLVVLCRIALCKNHLPPHPSPLQGPTANERPSPPDRGEHLGIGGSQIHAQSP